MPWKSRYVLKMNIKGSLPTLILHNLLQGPNHGYQIAQEIKQKSKGVLDFKEGTLYPALHGLEAKGLISSSISTVNGRPRCCYKLTDKGKKALAKQMEEWDQFTGAIALIFGEA
jgi:PadR family transcriptional regulator, regulatory protein PadR